MQRISKCSCVGRLAHSYPTGGGAGHVTNHDQFHDLLELLAWSDSGTWQWGNCHGRLRWRCRRRWRCLQPVWRRRWRCSGRGLSVPPSPEFGAAKTALPFHLEADMPAKARLRRQRLNNCTMLEPKSYIRHAAFTMTTAMLEKHLIANCWQCLRRQFSIINVHHI